MSAHQWRADRHNAQDLLARHITWICRRAAAKRKSLRRKGAEAAARSTRQMGRSNACRVSTSNAAFGARSEPTDVRKKKRRRRRAGEVF